MNAFRSSTRRRKLISQSKKKALPDSDADGESTPPKRPREPMLTKPNQEEDSSIEKAELYDEEEQHESSEDPLVGSYLPPRCLCRFCTSNMKAKRENWTSEQLSVFMKYYEKGLKSISKPQFTVLSSLPENLQKLVMECHAECDHSIRSIFVKLKHQKKTPPPRIGTVHSGYEYCRNQLCEELKGPDGKNPVDPSYLSQKGSEMFNQNPSHYQGLFDALKETEDYAASELEKKKAKFLEKCHKMTIQAEKFGLECLIGIVGPETLEKRKKVNPDAGIVLHCTPKATSVINRDNSRTFSNHLLDVQEEAYKKRTVVKIHLPHEQRKFKTRREYKAMIDNKMAKARISHGKKGEECRYTTLLGSQSCTSPDAALYQPINLPECIERVDNQAVMTLWEMETLIDRKNEWEIEYIDRTLSEKSQRALQKPSEKENLFAHWERSQVSTMGYNINPSDLLVADCQLVVLRLSKEMASLGLEMLRRESKKHLLNWELFAERINRESGVTRDDVNHLNKEFFNIIKTHGYTQQSVSQVFEDFKYLRDIKKVQAVVVYQWMGQRVGSRKFTTNPSYWSEILTQVEKELFRNQRWAEILSRPDGYEILCSMEDMLCDRVHVTRSIGRACMLTAGGKTCCEFCGKKNKGMCVCPPNLMEMQSDGKFTYSVCACDFVIASYSSLEIALKMCVGQYHIQFLHYTFGKSHCWLLDYISKQYQLGCNDEISEKIEAIEKYLVHQKNIHSEEKFREDAVRLEKHMMRKVIAARRRNLDSVLKKVESSPYHLFGVEETYVEYDPDEC